jgi:transcriptional regulator with XRE-family HTH domain
MRTSVPRVQTIHPHGGRWGLPSAYAVRHFRGKLGISQEELSFRAELDRTYMSGIERGVRNPTVKSLLRITRALGVRPSAVLKRAERGKASP